MSKNNKEGQAKLDSSFLTKMRWKGSNLTISIGKKAYEFIRVPSKVIKGLKKAESPGAFFNDKIKGRYQKPIE